MSPGLGGRTRGRLVSGLDEFETLGQAVTFLVAGGHWAVGRQASAQEGIMTALLVPPGQGVRRDFLHRRVSLFFLPR